MTIPAEVGKAIEERLGPEARAKAEAAGPQQRQQQMARAGHFRAVEEPAIAMLQQYLRTSPTGGTWTFEQVEAMINALGNSQPLGGGNGAQG